MVRFTISLQVCLWLMLLPAVAVAQTGATLGGVISDQNGDVVTGARIDARHLATGQTISTTTDAAGKYQLTGLRFGDYHLSVNREGFTTYGKNIRLRASGANTADFVLVPGAIAVAVTVTAGKGNARLAVDIPQPVSVTGAAEIEARRTPSVMQALDSVPNLLAIGANPLAARPRLRGLASNRLLVVVDGERLNNVRSDPFSGISLAVIDVTQLESAEVLGGAGSSLYGSDAIAGTINLVTRDAVVRDDRKHLGVRLDADARTNGFFRRGAATINASSPRIALRLSGSLFRLGNYTAGGGGIRREEVARIGAFANQLGNAVNSNVARTFAVWELPAGGEIPNAQGHGFYNQFDFRIFPKPGQSIRLRQQSSQHKNIGFAFLSPPFDVREQSNRFRRLDKYGLRYEAHGLRSWLPRLSVGGYRQKYVFPDDTLTYSITAGSSWTLAANENPPPATLPRLTGNASLFTPANFTDGKSTVTSYGFEAQATLEPIKNGSFTTSLSYVRDSSVDQFSRFDFSPTTRQPQNFVSGRATTPDTVYRNVGWSNLLEYEPRPSVRLSGGVRVDHWRTTSQPTRGFPFSGEASILDASFERLRTRPGALDIDGASGILDLINGTRGIETNQTSITGNAGVVGAPARSHQSIFSMGDELPRTRRH